MNAHQTEPDHNRLKRGFLAGMALVLLAAAALAIYFPGLSGPYVLDDNENIAKNEAAAVTEFSAANFWRAMRSNDSGPFRRPLATLSFAVNHYFSGGFSDTFPFKLTNLAIHIANGALLLLLALKILRLGELDSRLTPAEQFYVATLAAGLWTVHPIQLTNVLYVVQRMNSLSALFVILGLLVFLEGRRRFTDSTRKGLLLMGSGALFGTLLGMGCKENAALLPLFALVIEFSFFQHRSLDARQRLLLRSLYAAMFAAPLLAFLGYLYSHPEFLTEAYKVRHFSMAERLLTEARILWRYLYLIIFPNTHNLGLFHDDIPISRGLLTPPGTLLAICGLIVLLAIALTRKIPVLGFAILWFLAGHVLESSVFGLELAYEHRNYLPTFGIFFSASYLFVRASRHWRAGIRFAVVMTVISTLGFATWSLANTWKDVYSLSATNVLNHPESPRANEFAASVNAAGKGDLVSAIYYSIQALQLAPDEAGFHIDLQVFLARLASRVERDMRSAGIDNARETRIQIKGLPPEVIATANGRAVRLYYPPSTSDTIEALLKTKPITVHTLGSLIALDRCILDRPDECKRLAEQGVKWHTIAADNPVTAKTYNALILNNTAELYANMSDYASALTYINRATQAFPDVLYYRLNKIEYLIKLGRLDDARSILSTIDSIRPEDDIRLLDNRETIKAVHKIYAEAVDAASGHR